MAAMTLEKFRKLSRRDFENGAVRNEIEEALEQNARGRELAALCNELDVQMDGVRYPATAAAAILNRMTENELIVAAEMLAALRQADDPVSVLAIVCKMFVEEWRRFKAEPRQ